jgi:hypothetical protein
MRDGKHCGVLELGADHDLYEGVCLVIDRRGGLVEDQYLGLPEDGSSYTDQLHRGCCLGMV